MPFPNLPLMLFYCTSPLAIVILLQLMLQFLKNKYSFKFQSWQYTTWTSIFIFILSCGSGVVLYHQESLSSIDLLVISACSLVYMFFKQEEGFCDVDINSCQKDSESIGAFCAHHAYDAYYKIVLDELIERIMTFEKEHDIMLFIKKLVIVIPLSCDVENIFTDKDECITYVENLPTIECDQGANINRNYRNPVYKINLKEDEHIYIVAESPSILFPFQFSINKEEFIYHRDCFIKTLKILVKNSPCIVAVYNDSVDSPEPLSRFLLSVLREEKIYTPIAVE